MLKHLPERDRAAVKRRLRRAWSFPWRYLQGSEVVGVGIPLPPLTVEVRRTHVKRRQRKPVPAPKPVEDAPQTSIPARTFAVKS